MNNNVIIHGGFIYKKSPHWRSFVQTPINKFRANRLLKDPYTSKACFYNLNSPFSNKLVLSSSKDNTNVGSNYIFKRTYFKLSLEFTRSSNALRRSLAFLVPSD